MNSEQARQRALQGLVARKVAAAADEIAPELLEYIGGDSEEAIDASIELAKAKSASLVQRALQVQPVPGQDPAVVNVNQGIPDVGDWSMQEYARHRNSLLGIPTTAQFLGGAR